MHITTVDADRTVGDLVAERPERARVLESAGIDYCCHGHRSLAVAAAEAGIELAAIAADLSSVSDDTDVDVATLTPAQLVDHIEVTHHAYLHAELPLLHALAAKVAGVHAERHPELTEVMQLVQALRADLEPHLAKEERVLFPAIRRLAAGPAKLPFGSMANPIGVMRREHEQAGELLAALRAVTSSYAVPDDACASYRSLYERLPALERDTFRHIHLENNVLFPAVETLETRRRD